MHFYMFNPADFNNSARHLSLPERAIYRDLIDMYYNTEQAIDTSDMDSLARRLLCTNTEYRASLEYVLDEFFIKRGKRHHHHRIDREIKNYKFKNSNASGNAVTFDVTQGVTLGNATRNVTCNDDEIPMTNAERTRKSRQDKRNMINALTSIGVSVDKDIKAADLRDLYATHADSITSNVTTDVTTTVTNDDDACNGGNAKNAAITTNHEPVTNNHKPVSESDAHTNAGEGIVDKSNHGSVDNSTDDNQPSDSQPAPVELSQPTQSSANQPATKADLIRDQRADDIENWEAPTIDEMRGELFRAGKMMQLTDDQYSLHVEDFKAHYAEQALLGRALATESNRKAKLRKWLMSEVDKQAANQARQEKAKGRFSTDNEEWGTTANKGSSNFDSDLPPVFHPSHAKPTIQAKRDPSVSVVVNGLWKEPLPNMSVQETYEYIAKKQMPGEMQDEAYDRLLNQMKEAV
ncbi:YdaU family protein [Psychrobacter aquaticus]|uniref:DUF1376 domain-containing protein n=1 Tax=Psychrobacter aquaticus CMS 56 TaxID=1354303 RepID=U4T249_9GAMM|nr:YdaU family protein [Psychrobacter aquaticus]ERL54972.1 protein of unknown function DUF1376 [Psychrobacter aquaticus CMS 56]